MKTNIHLTIGLILAIIFLSPNHIKAQKATPELAIERMNNYDYVKAIAIYTDYFKTKTPLPEDIRNITYCYLITNETKLAKEWVSRLVNIPNPEPKELLLYANLLKNESEYDQAIVEFTKYKTLVPNDNKVDELIQSCKSAISWIQNPTYFEVANLGELNTEYADFGLIPYKNGYVFTSDRKLNKSLSKEETYGWTGNSYLKLYQTQGSKSASSVEAMTDLNDKFHNGPGQFDSIHQEFYFTRTKMVRVKLKNTNNDPTSWIEKVKTSDYENRLEIYIAKNTNGKWTSVLPFQYNKPEDYSVGHPTLSADGNTLYFVSNMPNGFGETDIYSCQRNQDGSWKQPENLGKTINTSGKEMFPFIDKDGTLYFSSDGHEGMGGLDIFKSTFKNNTWSPVENLKSPINSSKDDFSVCFTQSGKSGYLSSNRYGGKGDDDIYSFNYNPPSELMIVVIPKQRDENNNIVPLDGMTLKIQNITENRKIEEPTFGNGTFNFTAKCKNTYYIAGSKEGYLIQSKTIETECKTRNDTVFVEIVLEKLKINESIVLKNIYYDFDKSFIREDAMADLNKVVKIMTDNPDIIVELGSHTDSRGSDDYNIKLSQRRADAAVQYIISKGIDKKRITAKGYGETQLLNKCSNGVECTEEEHQLNRRTAFKVTGFIKGKNVQIKSDL